MNRRIGLIALAIVLALIGTFAVYSYAHHADQRALDKTRSATVLYAKKPIPAGTKWGDVVKGGFVAQENLPVQSAPSTALQNDNVSIPLGQVATADVASGQVVIREMFAQKVVATGALAIPKGLIAVSVKLPSNADVAGFVINGSEVAIYLTSKVTKLGSGSPILAGGTDAFVTKVLVPRATVLATSAGAPTSVNGAKAANTSNDNLLVTLALPQKDVERLVLAQQVGSLYLGLLSETSVSKPDGGTTNVMITNPVPIFLN
jgi:pilus assembly protein CpaB